MLLCVRWYADYPFDLRHIEEMMAERGAMVHHATIHRWALKRSLVLAKAPRRRTRPWLQIVLGSICGCYTHVR
jgi:putative transposase